MRRAELELRKELAITRLRIARTELALARAQKPNSLATASSAIDLASSILATQKLGGWAKYLRIALSVAHMALGVRKAI